MAAAGQGRSPPLVVAHALAKPEWGHRKIWAMTRHDGHKVSQATVLRLLRDDGLILPSEYQKQRRELAADRKAAFAVTPTGPNQVWQLDFSEFETTTGGTWRIAGCRDWYSKLEHRFHTSPTANQHDAIAAVELALADYEAMFGHPSSTSARSTPTPVSCCRWSRSSPTTAARSGR
ncbi:IS3 family transposase [Microbacterium sp. NIBRBAC000506063]|uniref:IS3 family transposase n=1 Tax=Microbacterium sp. NIBRBAC000506063 TaxID=2734618 RepID=UPI001CB74A99|nr:IS3 family transposase [Microbacterium sp. NIBRBAC000506063]